MIMSSNDPYQKVRADHLKRDAYLYIRQSTLHQVFHNTESTKRQYALKQRAVALGWPAEHVIIIDGDQGHSGASAVDREGFQKLVAEVGLGHAGIVLGLEVSRLARNSCDWHRLLEICGLTSTLILDEDGLYDPSQFNDRLLLGLKGTMSEAELHVLRARLQGGIRNKARRGELRVPLPVGLVYDTQGHVTQSNVFAANLDSERKEHDMSQAELARAAGLMPSAISHLERGKRGPSAETLMRLAKALGTSADGLLGLPVASQPPSQAIQRLMRAVAHLPDKEVQLLVRIAQFLGERP